MFMRQARYYKGFRLAPLNNSNGHWVQILNSRMDGLDVTACKNELELAFRDAQNIIDNWEKRGQIKRYEIATQNP